MGCGQSLHGPTFQDSLCGHPFCFPGPTSPDGSSPHTPEVSGDGPESRRDPTPDQDSSPRAGPLRPS